VGFDVRVKSSFRFLYNQSVNFGEILIYLSQFEFYSLKAVSHTANTPPSCEVFESAL
jgi:hypothetical protein